MILQELTRYYERKLTEGDIAPPGFEQKEIPYLIVIDNGGNFVRFDPMWVDDKEKRAKTFLVPKGVKRARGVESNLLWDNSGYIFGISKEGESEKEKATAFYQKIKKLNDFKKNKKIESIISFLENFKIKEIKNDDRWAEIAESGRNLTFKLKSDDDIICADEEVFSILNNFILSSISDTETFCLLSGQKEPIARLHNSIQGVMDANPMGASIISFNLTAFESYGKEQSFNAPVSEKSMFAYTTALNTMLGKGSYQKLRIGDATVVFWAEKKNQMEEILSGFFNSPQGKTDDHSLLNESLKLLYQSPLKGKPSIFDDDTPFFVLGLSPNAARLSVRFWYQGNVGEVARNIKQHFDDLEIDHADFQVHALTLIKLLKSTSRKKKDGYDFHPILSGEMMKSILTGSLYPRLLLLSVIQRLHADHDTNSIKQNEYPRMALIKAYLNRYYRVTKNKNFKEITKTMDENNTNTAYRLGRAFAVLENIQSAAIPGANSTIRDRYFTSASARPAYVFPVLMAHAQHHISKAEGLGVVRDKLLQEILEPVNGFPRIQSLEDQGLFSLGYYHQKQALYKKKEV